MFGNIKIISYLYFVMIETHLKPKTKMTHSPQKLNISKILVKRITLDAHLQDRGFNQKELDMLD